MRRVFIVVGHAGSRKSSTIRALTGIGKAKIFQVRVANDGTLNIYVSHSSLQEKKISPADFITLVERKGDPDVLVALQTRGSRNGEFPDAQEYASQFMQAGWQIAGVASLYGGPRDPLIADTPVPIQNDRFENMASNEIASIIRVRWNWL